MRISDWSSDVCSSDLIIEQAAAGIVLLLCERAVAAIGAGDDDRRAFGRGGEVRVGGTADHPEDREQQQQRDRIADHDRLLAPDAIRQPPEEHEPRSEEHTSELQSLMRNSYAVF